MPTYLKRRFQDGVGGDTYRKWRVSKAWCRQVFLKQWRWRGCQKKLWFVAIHLKQVEAYCLTRRGKGKKGAQSHYSRSTGKGQHAQYRRGGHSAPWVAGCNLIDILGEQGGGVSTMGSRADSGAAECGRFAVSEDFQQENSGVIRTACTVCNIDKALNLLLQRLAGEPGREHVLLDIRVFNQGGESIGANQNQVARR